MTFQDEQAILCLSRAKITLVLGITVFPAFAVLDYFFTPHFFGHFFFLRILATLEGILFLLLLRNRTLGLKFANGLVIVYGATLQGIISYMCLRLGGFNSPYYTGLIVVILGICLLMPWPAWDTILLNSLTYVGYLSQGFFVGLNAPGELLMAIHFFLIGSFVLTAIGSFLQYRLYFLLHEQRKVIQDLSELKSQLMSIASHDLRGPLSVIRDTLEEIRREGFGGLSPRQNELLQLGEKGVSRMLSLVRDLLDFHLIEAGKMRIEKRSVDLAEVIQSGVEQVQPEAEKKQVKISIPRDLSRLILRVDSGRITQVLDNLLRNAIRHSPEGGEIRVELQERSGEVVLGVSDQGDGIPPDHLPKLFQQFSRFGEASGLGLGLFISRTFVEMHGGRIWTESAPGRGSTFYFSLPFTSPPF